MENKKAVEKMQYEKASAEIVYFENDDVITTSGGESSGSGGGRGCYISVW